MVLGTLYILLSSIGFGSNALFANLAYQDGVDTVSLLTWRFLVAAALLGGVALARGARLPRGVGLAKYVSMGVMYAVMAWAYFEALHFASSALVAMVLYVYPVLVAVAAAALRIERFGLAEAGALLLSSAGLVLVLGGSVQGSGTGLLLALASACCYACYILIGARDVGNVDTVSCSAVVLTTAAACLLVLALWRGPHWPHRVAGWAAVASLAVFGTAIAIAAFVAGLERIGPTRAAVLSTLEPLVTVVLGVVFLHERATAHAVAGGALISASAAWLVVARQRRDAAMRATAATLAVTS